MTVLGIDISKWDGNWDAAKAKNAGAVFVYIKASQATFTDVQFISNWKKAREAGLLRGAYHYLDYSKTAVKQANYFADLLKNDPGELPPVVDYEQGRSDNNPATALAFLRGFLDQMKTRTELYGGMKTKVPMIYTSPGFWKEYGDTTKREYWLQFPLWVANYTTAATPYLPAPWTFWHFWQFSAKGPGEAYGSESLSMDMNRFNGTEKELLEFAGQPVATPAPDPVPENSGTGTLLTLEQRTAALEEALARIKLSADGALISRVENLEQYAKSIAQTITNSHALLENRLTALEKGLPVVEITPTPETDGNAAPDSGSASEPAEDETSNMESGSNSDLAMEEETEDDTALYATCKVNTLNVRKGPATTYAVVTYLKLGQRVKVLARQDGWAQIEDPAGWSSEPYLIFDTETMANPATNQESSEAITYGVCNTSGLNVRSGPANTYSIIGGLTFGQRVRILERRDGWAQIESPAGWCNENYLSFN